MMSSEEVATIGYEGMLNKKSIVIPGFKNKVITFLPRLLPRKTVVSIIQKIAKKIKESKGD